MSSSQSERLRRELDTLAWRLRQGEDVSPDELRVLIEAVQTASHVASAEDVRAFIERLRAVKEAASLAREVTGQQLVDRRRTRRGLAAFRRASQGPGRAK